jgi:hypothetical protein
MLTINCADCFSYKSLFSVSSTLSLLYYVLHTSDYISVLSNTLLIPVFLPCVPLSYGTVNVCDYL